MSESSIQIKTVISDDYKQQIQEAFDLFDSDKDGYMDYQELKTSLRALGFDMKKADILKLLNEHNIKDIEKINFQSFHDFASELIQKRDPREEILKAFKLFDDDNSGKISLKNLKRVAKELGENLTDEELKSMIDEFDHDGDGEIDHQEFVSIMSNDT